MNYSDSVIVIVSRRVTAVLVVIVVSMSWSPFTLAQEEGEQSQEEQPKVEESQAEMSADDTAKALANPT